MRVHFWGVKGRQGGSILHPVSEGCRVKQHSGGVLQRVAPVMQVVVDCIGGCTVLVEPSCSARLL